MKKFVLSIIVIFCVYPVANAGNSNVKLKAISESEQSISNQEMVSNTATSLLGVGFELYHKLSKYTVQAFNQEKSRTEKRLEKIKNIANKL